MDSYSNHYICETCGHSYVVDGLAESHMDPPDGYRRGYQRYCLACWLGVGPSGDSELLSASEQPGRARKETSAAGALGREIQLKRRQTNMQLDRNSADEPKPSRPSVYLWLCCEGWMKFGPFEWLRCDDGLQAILGPNGEVVAKKIGGYWQVPSGRGEGMQFSDPTITTTSIHPHMNSGSHPGRIR
jgi:hypothetical protein